MENPAPKSWLEALPALPGTSPNTRTPDGQTGGPHAEEWFGRVLWSDEKWFVLTPAPNRKNTVYWCPSNPHNIVPCKRAHGEKVMVWVGIVDGKCLPVH